MVNQKARLFTPRFCFGWNKTVPLGLVIESEPEHGFVEVIGNLIRYTPKDGF